MTTVGFMRNPPKYSCSVCGKLFRRRKQKDDHILFNRCKGMKGTKKQNIIIEQITEPELVSLKDEIVHYNPQTTKYYGTEYTFSGLATGNRHLRTGGPQLQGYRHIDLPLPRISIYKRAAI